MNSGQPVDLERRFYQAFAELDIDAMRRVWSPASDVYCVHPGGGLIQGFDAVLASWASIFRGSEPPQFRYRLLHATQDQHLVIHTVEETIRSAGAGRQANVIATNAYRRDADGWRMLLHHASLPLVERGESETLTKPLH